MGCQNPGTSPTVPGGTVETLIPDTCPPSVTKASSITDRRALGVARLVLSAPTGTSHPAGQPDDPYDCRGAAPFDGVLVGSKAGAGFVDYQVRFDLPSFLPLSSSTWAIQPPALVTRDGVVTRPLYSPTAPQSYTGNPGAAVAVSRLTLEGPPDDQAPALIGLSLPIPAALQGQSLSVSFQVSDNGSGLLQQPVTQPGQTPLLARPAIEIGLLTTARGFSNFFPLFNYAPQIAGTTASAVATGVVPGLLPTGDYAVYAMLRDRLGNSALYQPGPVVETAPQSYQGLSRPVCQLTGRPPTALKTQLQPAVATVTQSGADQTPPLVIGLTSELADVGPCEPVTLHMKLKDNAALPATQRAWLWVGPQVNPTLDGATQAAVLTQVAAAPGPGGPGDLVATLYLPADARTGTWIFLPAYAVDSAGNPVIGAFQPVTLGQPAQAVLLDPLTRAPLPLTTGTVVQGTFKVRGAGVTPSGDGGGADGGARDGGVSDGGARDGGVDAGTGAKDGGGSAVSSVPARLEKIDVTNSGATYLINFRYSHPDISLLP